MAFTLTKVQDGDNVVGRDKTATFDVQITSTYTAGGYEIDASDVGLKFFKGILIVGGDVSQLTYYPFFDFGAAGAGGLWTTLKLRFSTASGTEATGSLSPTVNYRFQAFGG